MSLFTKTANDTFAPYDVAGNAREIVPQDAQVWGTEVERVITGFQAGGGIIFPDKATMDATLTYAANQQAWVMGDGSGIYRKIGASGTGSWVRLGDLPYSFIIASDVGAGTPNAIQAVTSIPVSGSALIWTNIFEANTASPVTISFNGGSSLTVKTNSGNDVASGGLAAGMIVLGIISGTTFRLLNDQVSSAIVAAAEAAQAAAEAARDEALAAVPIFNSREVAATYNLASFSTVIVNRFSNALSIAPANYVKVPQPANLEPTSPLKFQSADGYWFIMAAAKLDLSACGETLDVAIGNAVAHATVSVTMELTSDMTVAADVTVPKGWTFRIVGGRINVSTGRKLNMQGRFKAPMRQVFTGNGVVVGIKRPYFYWWGGAADWNGTTGTDCSPALQKAVACVQAPETGTSDGHGHPSVLAGGGNHLLNSGVVFAPTLSSPTGLEGNGAMLGTASGTRFASLLSGGICFYVAATYLPSDNNRLCNFKLRNFVLDESVGVTNLATGLFIGDAGLDGANPNNGSRMIDSSAILNCIENVHVREFYRNVHLNNVRNLRISNSQFESKTRAGCSLVISVTKAGKFSGEIVIESNVVLLQPANQGSGIYIEIPTTITADAEIRGIKILTGCIYGGQYKVNVDVRSNATYKAYAGHWWFDNGFQLDAGFSTFSDYGIYVGSYGANSRVEEISMNSPYFAGITVCGIWMQQFLDGAGYGAIQGITINSPMFNYCVNELIHFEGGRGVSVDNPQIYNCGNAASTATRYFYFNNTTDWSVRGTKRIKADPVEWPGGTITKGLQIDGGASDRYIARGNSFLTTTPVNDNVVAVNRDVAANW